MSTKKKIKEKPAETVTETVKVEETPKKTEADKFLDEAHLLVDSVTEDVKIVLNKETPDEKRTIIAQELREKLKKFAASMQPYIDKMTKYVKEDIDKALKEEFPYDRYSHGRMTKEFIHKIETVFETINLLHDHLARATNYTLQERIAHYREGMPDMAEEKAKHLVELLGDTDTCFGGHQVGELNHFFKESTKEIEEFLQAYYFASVIFAREFQIKDEAEASAIANGSQKLPNFNDRAMQLLLSQMMYSSATGNYELLKGVYESEKFSMEWTLNFYTSPRQLKMIFADNYSRYPQFTLFCHFHAKNRHYGSMGEHTIDLQYAYALIRGSIDVQVPPLNPSKKEEH